MTSLNTSSLLNSIKDSRFNSESAKVLDDLKTASMEIAQYIENADLDEENKENLFTVIGGLTIQIAGIERAAEDKNLSIDTKQTLVLNAQNSVKKVNEFLAS